MGTQNIVISKEYIDTIRRYAAIKPDESFVYVPEAFRTMPEEMRPKFTLRPISGETALRYADTMRGEVTVESGRSMVAIKRGEYTVNVVRAGLIMWENYYDIDGKIVPCEKGNISNLPISLLEELSEAITTRSRLTNEEVLGLR